MEKKDGFRAEKILIVDDEKTTREILSRALLAKGFVIRAVSDGIEALEILQKEPFDLMLTDIMMPNMGGIELIEKSHAVFPNLITIVITAHADLETAVKALQQGAYDYIVKPFAPEIILPVIERGLEKSRISQRNLELTHVTKKMKELDQMKSDLLDTITHEFSTPIAIIKAYIDMYIDGHLDPSSTRYLEGLKSIRSAVIRLERLVMNLLTLSMGRGKTLELKKEKILIQDIISSALTQLREDITKKNINVLLNIEPNLPTVEGDPTKLSIAMLNLVDNAVKFNKPNGAIRISASRLEKSNGIGVAISDTGIGIPDEKISQLYNPFTQVDMSSTREHQGTGLGLAVAKTIIEAHGGKLTLKSKVGKGTTFIFVLAC
jgi:two-component system sensor histidine kinase ChiS